MNNRQIITNESENVITIKIDGENAWIIHICPLESLLKTANVL